MFYKEQYIKVRTWIWRLFMVCLLGSFGTHIAHAEMSTSNFRITQDVVGSFGSQDTSANFGIGDTGGEVATGPADAVNFGLNAGFWQATKNNPILQVSILDSVVDLGTLDTTLTRYDTAQFTVATNAFNGYVVEYFGPTLSFGSNTIDGMNPAQASSIGTEQFGINVVANTTPSVGVNPSGGVGQAASGYDTADQFKFLSGDVLAESLTRSQKTTYTMSVISNIDGISAAGEYETDIILIVTGRF